MVVKRTGTQVYHCSTLQDASAITAIIYRWQKLIFRRLWCCKPIVLQVLYFVTLFLWNLSVQEPSVRMCMHMLNLTVLM
jgi:hypothetical protein